MVKAKRIVFFEHIFRLKKLLLRRAALLSFSFAFVYLPPLKEVEDWKNPTEGIVLPKSNISILPESALSSQKIKRGEPNSSKSHRFSFNGTDLISFSTPQSKRAEWEVRVSPVEQYIYWPTGAWTGVSLGSADLHHFYVRGQRRGLEAKYRNYELGQEWTLLDLAMCSPKQALILQKQVKNPLMFRLILVGLVSSQELIRERFFSFTLEEGQDVLSFRDLSNCNAVHFNSWPVVLGLKLN